MGLQDRFRIDELVKKGSNAIRKDSNGNILVSKKDGKQKKPKLSSTVKRKFDKTKEDLANPQLVNPNENQTDFAGETSGYVEKPKYNEDELKKALDVKVDELIKKKKPNKGPYILKSKYDAKLLEIEDLRKEVAKWRKLYEEEVGVTTKLTAELEALLELLDSIEIQRAAAENNSTAINTRYVSLLSDFQNSIIKGTKEGIERVSLEAQVRGLQAQKLSLQEQLKLKDQIEEAEEAQQETQAILASLTGPDNSYDQKGESGWKVPEPHDDPSLFETRQIHFRSNRKSSGWAGMDSLELYNFNEEAEATWSISVASGPGGHGQPWLGFSKSSGTIPPRSGETPGKVEIDAKKIRNVNSPKGRRREFTDDITLTIGPDTYNLKGIFYRKLRKGGDGN